MKTRTKKKLTAILTATVGIAAGLGIVFGCIYAKNRPKTTFDFAQKCGEIKGGASGFLYGLAEPGIPTKEMAESIGISTLSTKALGGLQHPIGDVNQVADTFLSAGGKEIIVYTQDMYDTWYYQFDSLDRYHERVKQTVTETVKKPYANKVVYCIYNEMDNGQWYGDFKEYENRVKTYEAWKATYALVRSIDPNAKIGGPGYCNYKSDYIKEFLEYCKTEDCLPDTMIWHELGKSSLYMWEEHFADYEAICTELNINKMPVCITEYGLMSTNGIPGESVKWISRIESVKCEGCVAYWRLADNLSDVAADDTTPNSNWWAYFWYNAMRGETVQGTSKDLFQSNMGKFLTRQSKSLKYSGFTGLAAIDEENGEIQILAGGSNRNSDIVLENLGTTDTFKNAASVCVTAEYVDYKGLSGAVYTPKTAFTRIYPVTDGKVTIALDDILYTQCYHITVTPLESTADTVAEFEEDTAKAMRRYEAEDAKCFGTAKSTKDVSYAASEYALVKANSTDNSGVEFTVDISEDNTYKLDLIYGNGANGTQYDKDGKVIEKGVRSDVALTVTIDGVENTEPLLLPSTIKDDYTDCVSVLAELKAGKHTVRFTLKKQTDDVERTVSFDYLDVTANEVSDNYIKTVSTDLLNNTSKLICITDTDTYYSVQFSAPSAPTELTLNGCTLRDVEFTKTNDGNYRCILFLRRGINSIELNAPHIKAIASSLFYGDENQSTTVFSADAFILTGNARLETTVRSTEIPSHLRAQTQYIDGIASDTDAAVSVSYTAPKDGYYQLTFTYSNNEEGGAHDYNVDLVERYITLAVNGEARGNHYFRSTYSWENFKTKTVTVYLHAGENVISFTNDGSYQFNGKTAYAPHISDIAISPVILSER